MVPELPDWFSVLVEQMGESPKVRDVGGDQKGGGGGQKGGGGDGSE